MCVKLFDFFSKVNTHPFDLKFVAFCPKFSRYSYVEIQEKNYFGRIFQKFCGNQGYHLLFWVRISLKIFTQVLSYVVCSQVTIHVHKQITKTRYGVEKLGRFVHSRSGTYYASLLGYFGLKFLPNIRHYVYWVLAGIWTPDSSHKIHNNFFIRHCQSWKEGSFVCETIWYFS